MDGLNMVGEGVDKLSGIGEILMQKNDPRRFERANEMQQNGAIMVAVFTMGEAPRLQFMLDDVIQKLNLYNFYASRDSMI